MADAADAEKVEGLSLKDLRALVKEAGLSSEDCIEKAQLRARAVEALDRLKLPGAKLGPVGKTLGLVATEAAPSAAPSASGSLSELLGDNLLTKEREVPTAMLAGTVKTPSLAGPVAPEAARSLAHRSRGRLLNPTPRVSREESPRRVDSAERPRRRSDAQSHRFPRRYPSRLAGKKLVMLYFSAHWRGTMVERRTAHQRGLLGRTLQAPGCATHSARGAKPLRG